MIADGESAPPSLRRRTRRLLPTSPHEKPPHEEMEAESSNAESDCEPDSDFEPDDRRDADYSHRYVRPSKRQRCAGDSDADEGKAAELNEGANPASQRPRQRDGTEPRDATEPSLDGENDHSRTRKTRAASGQDSDAGNDDGHDRDAGSSDDRDSDAGSGDDRDGDAADCEDQDSDHGCCDSEYEVDIQAYEAMREVMAEKAGIVNRLPRFTERTYPDSASALAAKEAYEEANLIAFRVRDACTTCAWNEKNPGKKVTGNRKFKYRRFVLYCTHGCKQKSRTTGIRSHAHTRYTGCKARVTFMLTSRLENGRRCWRYTILSENTTHNHKINSLLYSAYQNSTAIADDELLGPTLDVLVQTNTDVAQIAQWLSAKKGVPISPQRTRNILAGRLGGPNAEARMKQIVGDFLSVEGNRGAFLEDDGNLTVGVVLQSRMQAAAFEQWPEVLVLDFTYNTNNLGFKVGSLVVTGPTGRGLPVLDFLCLSETKLTVSLVLKYFKETNPAAANIEAFIVDKSMAEMGAIESVFPTATIFLCQFHVKQAVGRALAQRRFSLSPQAQREVIDLFSKLVYARREADYAAHLRSFRGQVGKTNAALLEYFERNWFQCRDKWSNVGRSETFSCGNSTTNRVESNWTRIKAILAGKTGIDRCVSAILQHQLNVYQQLHSALTFHEASSRTYIGIPYFLRPVASVLSDYALEKVSTQCDYFHASASKWTTATTPAPLVGTTPAPFAGATAATTTDASSVLTAKILTVTTPTARYTVSRSGPHWTCTCFFAVSQRLPCQHMMHVAHDVLGRQTLTRASVPARWDLSKMLAIEPLLSATISAMNVIRLLTLDNTSSKDHGGRADGRDDCVIESARKVQYVRVPRGARVHGPRVLSPTEKRAIIRSELEPLTDMIVHGGAAAFYERVNQLHELVQALVETWRTDGAVTEDEAGSLSSELGVDQSDTGGDTSHASEGSEQEDRDDLSGPETEFPPDTSDERECSDVRYPQPDSDYEQSPDHDPDHDPDHSYEPVENVLGGNTNSDDTPEQSNEFVFDSMGEDEAEDYHPPFNLPGFASFTPSQVSLPDLQLSASSLAIIELNDSQSIIVPEWTTRMVL